MMGPQRTDGPQPESTAAQLARAAGRLSTDKALQKRLVKASVAGAVATAESVKRASRKLWLEVTGFLFVCLSVIGGAEVWRKWESHETAKLWTAAAFAAMFAYFGVSSFWRARRPKKRVSRF